MPPDLGNSAANAGISLARLLWFLTPRQAVTLVASMLLERRIILVARDADTVSAAVHAANALLYPFRWQHIYLPLLPLALKVWRGVGRGSDRSNGGARGGACVTRSKAPSSRSPSPPHGLLHRVQDYLAAPMPYLVGIQAECLPALRGMALEETVLIDLDRLGSCTPPLGSAGDDYFLLPFARELEGVFEVSVMGASRKSGHRCCAGRRAHQTSPPAAPASTARLPPARLCFTHSSCPPTLLQVVREHIQSPTEFDSTPKCTELLQVRWAFHVWGWEVGRCGVRWDGRGRSWGAGTTGETWQPCKCVYLLSWPPPPPPPQDFFLRLVGGYRKFVRPDEEMTPAALALGLDRVASMPDRGAASLASSTSSARSGGGGANGKAAEEEIPR